jgi:hypothetical protein
MADIVIIVALACITIQLTIVITKLHDILEILKEGRRAWESRNED